MLANNVIGLRAGLAGRPVHPMAEALSLHYFVSVKH